MRLIDADALIKVFESWFVEVSCNPETGHTPFDAAMLETANEVIADAIRAIGGAKTLDVAPVVHGRWIYGITLNHEWRKCSECLVSQDIFGCFTYCPNCGARMDGEENASD